MPESVAVKVVAISGGALLAGLAGGLALNRPEPGATSDPDASVALVEIRREIDALRRQNEILLSAVRDLVRVAPVEPAMSPAAIETAAAPSRELAVAGTEPPAAAAALKDQVRAVLEEVRAAEQERRAAERAERREQRFDENLDRLARALKLDDASLDPLRRILLQEREAAERIREQYENFDDDAALSTALAASADGFHAQLAQVLPPDTLALLDERIPDRSILFEKWGKGEKRRILKGKQPKGKKQQQKKKKKGGFGEGA